MASSPSSLRIVTLNCWGLKYLSKYRHERLSQVGIELANAELVPDIVGLQECWTQQDYLAIRDTLKHVLPYGKFYFSGIFGGGLAILSKWPIEDSSMYRYPLNGRPTAFFRGDWFVGKGVACATIRYGSNDGDVAEVFCTHLHAPYEREPYDSYICHRTAQAWDIAKLMRGAADRGHLVIGLGDFNMLPLSLAHRLIEAHAPVKDVWRVLHPNSSLGAVKDAAEMRRGKPIPTAEYNITVNGATCDSALNTWRWDKKSQKRLHSGENIEVDTSVEDPGAKRLDYIFIGNGRKSISPAWTVAAVNMGMMQRHPTLRCSLSDHFSVEASLTRDGQGYTSHEHTAESAARTCTSLSSVSSTHTLPLEAYDDILSMIHKYTLRQRQQRRLRLSHFLLELFLSVGCLVAVWWVPHNFVSFILMLVSTLGLSAGVIDGLIGGLFVSSELRALKEFEWEITNAKNRAARESGISKLVV